MHRVYEIFVVLPNGSPHRVTIVSGLDSAKARLHELANQTPNECFAADARTRQIVALTNVPPSKWRATKHIFQITYDEQLGARRAELLKSHGYRVMSVIGNEAAKLVFIVGHAAPEETRQEMVLWRKTKYRRAKILALNPPNQEILRADYNVRQNGPENWFPIISREFAKSADSQGSNKATGGA